MLRRVKTICVLLKVAPVVNRIPDELSQRFESFCEEGINPRCVRFVIKNMLITKELVIY